MRVDRTSREVKRGGRWCRSLTTATSHRVALVKTRPVALLSPREKMPFEVTPFMPYLTRFGSEAAKPIAASANGLGDPAPSVPVNAP